MNGDIWRAYEVVSKEAETEDRLLSGPLLPDELLEVTISEHIMGPCGIDHVLSRSFG